LTLSLTNVFFANFIFSGIDRPPKNSLQRPKTSSCVKVRGRSVRYAKPVVENTSSKRVPRMARSSGEELGELRAERETTGRLENEVDMLLIREVSIY
jgi:hypothetical protein